MHCPFHVVSSAGAEAVDLAAEAGLILDDWQSWTLDVFLGERKDGLWAATECGCIVPRQNGKNGIQEAGELAGLYLFEERLITHSAHLFSTATEHFLRMRTLIENCKLLNDEVDDIYVANGKESIILRGGRRLKFFARSRGGGRGFTGDRVVFDEAYDLPPGSIGAMIPALSARPNPQVWYFSSAPHSDSKVLHGLRRRAMTGTEARLAYVEWSNEPDVDWEDRAAWAAANPALGIRITEEWIETELATMRELGDEFPRERLGVPSPEDAAGTVFGAGKWQACGDEHSKIDGPAKISLDVAPEMAWASFAAAGARADGVAHVELIDRRPGTAWVAARAKELAEKWDVPISIDPKSPVGGLVSELTKAGVPLHELGAGDLPKACAALQNQVLNGTLRHLGQSPLDAAVAGASIRTIGDTWIWARKTATADISPLVAVTVALWAYEQPGAKEPHIW